MNNTTTTRRAVLAGAATLSALAAPAAIAGASPSNNRLAELWQLRAAMLAQSRQNSQAYYWACESLPDWARFGEKYRYGGDQGSIWPAIRPHEETQLVPKTARLLRPSLEDLRGWFRDGAAGHEGDVRRGYRARYRHDVRLLVDRVRCQRELRERARIDEIDREGELISDRISEVESEIEALPYSPSVVAALLLIAVSHNAMMAESLDQPHGGEAMMAAQIVELLRPHLVAPLSEAVAEFLDNPTTMIGDLSFVDHWRSPDDKVNLAA